MRNDKFNIDPETASKAECRAFLAAQGVPEFDPKAPVKDLRDAVSDTIDELEAKEAAMIQRRGASPRFRYLKNGQPMCRDNNSVSSLAWQATNNIDPDRPARIKTSDLVAMLDEAGIDRTAPWSFTLPNGKVIGAVAYDDLPFGSEPERVKADRKGKGRKVARAGKADLNDQLDKYRADYERAKADRESGALKARQAEKLAAKSSKAA